MIGLTAAVPETVSTPKGPTEGQSAARHEIGTAVLHQFATADMLPFEAGIHQ